MTARNSYNQPVGRGRGFRLASRIFAIGLFHACCAAGRAGGGKRVYFLPLPAAAGFVGHMRPALAGYKLDRRESPRCWSIMRQGGDKVVVKRNPVRDDAYNGTAIDFAQSVKA